MPAYVHLAGKGGDAQALLAPFPQEYYRIKLSG